MERRFGDIELSPVGEFGGERTTGSKDEAQGGCLAMLYTCGTGIGEACCDAVEVAAKGLADIMSLLGLGGVNG